MQGSPVRSWPAFALPNTSAGPENDSIELQAGSWNSYRALVVPSSGVSQRWLQKLMSGKQIFPYLGILITWVPHLLCVKFCIGLSQRGAGSPLVFLLLATCKKSNFTKAKDWGLSPILKILLKQVCSQTPSSVNSLSTSRDYNNSPEKTKS